jgi:dolichyl-phosphate-mannose--protein O-mannosyl transferase
VFKSHLISMVVFAGIVSVMLACLKRERARDIIRFAAKNFLYMTGGVILAGWLIHFL